MACWMLRSMVLALLLLPAGAVLAAAGEARHPLQAGCKTPRSALVNPSPVAILGGAFFDWRSFFGLTRVAAPIVRVRPQISDTRAAVGTMPAR